MDATSRPLGVEFGEPEVRVPREEEATTTATFGEPGEYLILVQAIDGPTSSFEFHRCWTNGYIPVTVVRKAEPRRSKS